MLKTGMRIEGTIQSAKRGQGVMRHGKDTIFVRHAMPGEQVRVRASANRCAMAGARASTP